MKQEITMNDTQRLDYIAACDLADCTHSVAEHAASMAAPAAPTALSAPDTPAGIEPASANAAVVSGSLVAFAQGVSRQNKDDVMDSLLFATLAASYKYKQEKESEDWYQLFHKVLATLGWVATKWNYSRYHTNQQRFTMDKVGLEVVKSAIAAAALPGPASLAMLKVAQDAITSLSAKEGPLGLFERQTKMHRGGNFRIASCNESEDGSVNIAMGAVAFQSALSVTNVLFWEWNNTDVDTYRGENFMTLNSGLYSGHRELVRKKLADKAKSAIEEFEI
jgi:hypothetical protein